MNRRLNGIRRVPAAIAIIIAISLITSGAAYGRTASPRAGAVATNLGSPDPHDATPRGGTYLGYAQAPDTNDPASSPSAHADFLTYAQSPDPKDAASVAPNVIVRSISERGFHWGDFGVGIVTALGLMLMVATGLHGARQRQRRLGSV